MWNFNDPRTQRVDAPPEFNNNTGRKTRQVFPSLRTRCISFNSHLTLIVYMDYERTFDVIIRVSPVGGWRIHRDEEEGFREGKTLRKSWGYAEFSWSITGTLMSLWCVSKFAACFVLSETIDVLCYGLWAFSDHWDWLRDPAGTQSLLSDLRSGMCHCQFQISQNCLCPTWVFWSKRFKQEEETGRQNGKAGCALEFYLPSLSLPFPLSSLPAGGSFSITKQGSHESYLIIYIKDSSHPLNLAAFP